MWDRRARVGDKERYFPASAWKVGAIIFLLFIFWQLLTRIHTHVAFRGEKKQQRPPASKWKGVNIFPFCSHKISLMSRTEIVGC